MYDKVLQVWLANIVSQWILLNPSFSQWRLFVRSWGIAIGRPPGYSGGEVSQEKKEKEKKKPEHTISCKIELK